MRICGALAVVAVLLIHAEAAQRPADITLYDGARLIAGDGRAPIERAAILVENGTIRRVGRSGDIRAPSGAARVDLAGKTIIPGLVSLHGHVGYLKGLTFSAPVRGPALSIVQADEKCLMQVLLNLVGNAIKFTGTGSITFTVNVLAEQAPEREVRFEIEDTGPGIDQRDEKQIFEPFFSTKPAGMGIGLTISHSIVVSHGGSLRTFPNKPYGTIFELALPTDPGP